MTKRLVIKTGSYEANGETKGEYTRLGVEMQGEHGPYLLIDPSVSLAGCLTKQNLMNHKAGKPPRTSILVNIFDDDEKKQAPSTNASTTEPQGKSFDDDIPF